MADDVLDALRAAPGFGAVLDALGGRRDVRVAGGAVRDALLGRAPRDLDLVVEGDAVALASELGELVDVHERFGTAEARVGVLGVGVASARVETYPAPGALPVIAPATLDDDLARRDFSVNAIAADLDGTLHGADGWRDDLGARRLRTLHARSFVDDPTRIWRAARYAARLGFTLTPETEAQAHAAVAGGALETVSATRLGAELLLALDEPDPVAALVAAVGLDLLPAGAAPDEALARAALALAPPDADAGALALAAICRRVDPGGLRAWLDAGAVGAGRREVVTVAAASAESLARELNAARRPSAVASVARSLPVEAVVLAGALGAEAPVRAWLDRLREVRLEIDGRDLLEAGIPAGPELGRALERSLAARLDGEATDRAGELAAALKSGGPT